MFDLIIQNGTVYDGTGSEGFAADVAIRDGKIVKVGKGLTGGTQILDATGLAVTPGFIDSHGHSDGQVISLPQQKEKVEQGITTTVAGQCGSTWFPRVVDGQSFSSEDYFREADETPQGCNLLTFVGHNALRRMAMGMENREPTAQELETMEKLAAQAMDAGAIGVSFGLIYTPSCYSQTRELIALAQVAKDKGGMIAAHIRNEGDQLIESVAEMIAVAKATGVRTVISHHKAVMKRNHGKVNTTLAMIEQANREGCDIYCDVYPYVASCTRLAATFIPKDYLNDHLQQHLEDPRLLEQFKAYIVKRYDPELAWVQLLNCRAYPTYTGLRLSEAAKLHGKSPIDTLMDILRQQPGCMGAYFSMCEEDMKTVMRWERTMIGTDSGNAGSNTSHHPRLRGTFPRVLGRYVRQQQVTTLPEMIRKMTDLPARVYSLDTKGRIAEGYDGDICVFDPETILDRADYADPTARAEGLRWVLVGGQIVAENAVCTGRRPGKVLRRK